MLAKNGSKHLIPHDLFGDLKIQSAARTSLTVDRWTFLGRATIHMSPVNGDQIIRRPTAPTSEDRDPTAFKPQAVTDESDKVPAHLRPFMSQCTDSQFEGGKS